MVKRKMIMNGLIPVSKNQLYAKGNFKKSVAKHSDLIAIGVGTGMLAVGTGGIVPLALIGAGAVTKGVDIYQKRKRK